jgi:hypothetical protein
MSLIVEHAHFGALRALALLPANLFDALGCGACGTALLGVDLIEQEPARQKAIERLGALLLAFDPDPCGSVVQHDAGRHFIYVLAAGARRADKLLVDIGFPHAERDHALGKLLLFVRRN